jgi:hypothetical protein
MDGRRSRLLEKGVDDMMKVARAGEREMWDVWEAGSERERSTR